MPKNKDLPKNQKKKLPAAPLAPKVEQKVKKNHEFMKRAKNFRIGGDVLPKKDLTRFVKWPQYIRLQRQKRIIQQRVKVPPALAQFQHTVDKTQFTQLARLMKKIAPETRAEKKARVTEEAKMKADGKKVDTACPPTVKYGINHVAQLVEQKKAKLVVIAHDVDPVEVVCWLPALCRKKDVPYCVVKSKARVGKMVNKKTCAALCVTQVKKEDIKDLETLCESFNSAFNDNKDIQRHWGGGIMGMKSQHVTRRRENLVQKELAKKAGMV